MPIHDVGYRTWKGRLTGAWNRWWTISEVGIRTALSSRWIRRIILASWFPVIYFGVAFFIYENAASGPVTVIQDQVGDQIEDLVPGEIGQSIQQELKENKLEKTKEDLLDNGFFRSLPNNSALVKAIENGNEGDLRHSIWSYLLSTFLGYSQGMVTFMIIGLVVPPLISRDVRSRAFLLYYSRPITRMEYVIGKLAIPAFILSLVTLLPGLVLYFVALMMSPDLTVVYDTWDLPFKVAVASLICIIPTCLIGLLLSSMTQESRFAGFAWFAIWGMGAVVWLFIYGVNSAQAGASFESNWSLISIYSTIGKVQSWIFGLEVDISKIVPSLVMLAALSAFALVMLYRRVSAPVRV